MTCSLIVAPASQAHSNGGVTSVQTLRPSAKNVTCRGVVPDGIRACSTTGPLT